MKLSPHVETKQSQSHPPSPWRTLAASSLCAASALALCAILLALLLNKHEQSPKYLFLHTQDTTHPQEVFPGEISKEYVEDFFSVAISLLVGWTSHSIESNMLRLFTDFFEPQLTRTTRDSLRQRRHLARIKEERLESYWRINKEESHFEWCARVALASQVRGVACGLVTGTQTIKSPNRVLSERSESFLVFGINHTPNPTSAQQMALRIFRIKRGPLEVLRGDLQDALERGVLPLEDHRSFVL